MMELTICPSCKTDLKFNMIEYDWLISRGYDQKYSSAKALTSPGGKQEKSCCFMHVMTSVDPLEEAKELEALLQKTEKAIFTDTLRIYNSNGRGFGKLILASSDEFDDPALLIGSEITNITLIPEEIAQLYRFEDETQIILWVGNRKLIPVVENKEGELEPGFFFDADNSSKFSLKDNIPRLLQSVIIDISKINRKKTQGQTITLKVADPKDVIFASGQ